MKKLILFCSLLCGIVFAGSAWAELHIPCDADKYCTVIVTDNSGNTGVDLGESCFRVNELFMGEGYAVQLFFAPGKYETKPQKYTTSDSSGRRVTVERTKAQQNCSECEKCLKNWLEGQQQGVAGVMVLSSTSRVQNSTTTTLPSGYSGKCKQTGEQKNNVLLGCLRAEHIVSDILPDWATGANEEYVRWGNNPTTVDYKTQVYDMGSTNDFAFGWSQDTDIWGGSRNDADFERMTAFYIVPKSMSCKEHPQYKAVRAYVEKWKDEVGTKFPQECVKLLEWCQTDDGFITNQQIDDMSDCITKFDPTIVVEPGTHTTETVNVMTMEWDKLNRYLKLFSRVDTAYSSLSVLLGNLSVWKDAQGKFNKSRFLSDTIAAVVLGTTSGVVTATLVKKNQIKKGFESLQCKIGGYKVADWGDSFMVGMTMR